jgi:myosin-9
MQRITVCQCIVISGESGSGKVESTNFLLHRVTALSQKGSHITLMMEAASTCKASVNFYQTAQGNIPEDSHLQYLILFEFTSP